MRLHAFVNFDFAMNIRMKRKKETNPLFTEHGERQARKTGAMANRAY